MPSIIGLTSIIFLPLEFMIWPFKVEIYKSTVLALWLGRVVKSLGYNFHQGQQFGLYKKKSVEGCFIPVLLGWSKFHKFNQVA